MKRFNKKGIESEIIVWWVIGIAVFLFMVIGYFVLKGKGLGAIDYIENLFRFGK